MQRVRVAILPLLPALLVLFSLPCPAQPTGIVPQRSVVKIHVTTQQPDYSLPWQNKHPGRGSGSGFIIRDKRILTNAHIVSNARFVEVVRDGDARRFPARIAFIAHDCDLAMLTVSDAAFFEGTESLKIATALPALNDEVVVTGYPTGGTRISITRGVVSRVDYAGYSHSGVDHHLVLQVDAAINPGNSGGPILFQGEVVGLAFQGMAWADNIGYAIPVPVIHHFLEDVEDGTYHGYPELGVAFLNTRNAVLRDRLGLDGDAAGVVVTYVDPYGCARGRLSPGDVLLSIDEYPIASDGSVSLEGNTLVFNELLERKQFGEAVLFSVLRDGHTATVTVPLRNPPDPFAFRNEYDREPRYLVHAGLVFMPLTRDYLRTVGQSMRGMNDQQLLYFMQYAKPDGHHEGRTEFVVFSRRLPHAVNTYTDAFLNGVVLRANGTPVSSLQDLHTALASNREPFHTLVFAGMDDEMILDADACRGAHGDIVRQYGIPRPARLEEQP